MTTGLAFANEEKVDRNDLLDTVSSSRYLISMSKRSERQANYYYTTK